jgi:hypothetical protein
MPWYSRLILIAVAGVIFYQFGYDGLRVNLNSKLQTFTMNEVASSGIGGARYIRITDGYPSYFYVYTTKENGGEAEATAIDYVLLTPKQFDTVSYSDTEKVTANVVITKEKITPGCVVDNSCLAKNAFEKGVVVQGVVQRGLDSLDSDSKGLFNDTQYNVDKTNFIYIVDGSKPRSIFINIGVMLLTGATILFVALRRRKA